MSTKQTNNMKQNNKRKRQQSNHRSPEEQYQIECTERYSKPYHVCFKQMYKEAKVVKSFECQKIVRAIKAANESITQQSEGGHDKKAQDAKILKKIEALEQKLERTKKLDLDVLVQVALKRLGVLSLDPNMGTDSAAEDEENSGGGLKNKQAGDGRDENASSQANDPFYQFLIETILRHKRLSTVMDLINEKVTDYNNWATHQEEMLQSDRTANDLLGKNAKKKKRQKQHSRDQNDTIVAGSQKRRKMDLEGHEGSSGLFIGSLSGQKVEGYSDDEEAGEYGAYGDGDLFEQKKKNRPGQRARKAKALAIEARKAGKTWDSSVNWREKKENADQEDSGTRQGRHDKDNKGNNRARSKNSGTTKAVP